MERLSRRDGDLAYPATVNANVRTTRNRPSREPAGPSPSPQPDTSPTRIGDSDERRTFFGAPTEIDRISVRANRSCATGALRLSFAASGGRHPDGPKRMRCAPSGARTERLGHARDGKVVLRSLARSVAGSVRGPSMAGE